MDKKHAYVAGVITSTPLLQNSPQIKTPAKKNNQAVTSIQQQDRSHSYPNRFVPTEDIVCNPLNGVSCTHPHSFTTFSAAFKQMVEDNQSAIHLPEMSTKTTASTTGTFYWNAVYCYNLQMKYSSLTSSNRHRKHTFAVFVANLIIVKLRDGFTSTSNIAINRSLFT